VKIATLATSPPEIIPDTAPRTVRPDHQMPSSSIGQKVLAARAKAQPTRTLMSRSRASRAISAGMSIPTAAALRNATIRWAGARVRRLRPMS
jgi:hypothetical protein